MKTIFFIKNKELIIIINYENFIRKTHPEILSILSFAMLIQIGCDDFPIFRGNKQQPVAKVCESLTLSNKLLPCFCLISCSL